MKMGMTTRTKKLTSYQRDALRMVEKAGNEGLEAIRAWTLHPQSRRPFSALQSKGLIRMVIRQREGNGPFRSEGFYVLADPPKSDPPKSDRLTDILK